MKQLTLILSALVLCASSAWAQVDYNVIPRPASVTLSPKGERFPLMQQAIVTYEAGSPELESTARLLCQYVQEASGLRLQPQAGVKKGASVLLALGLKSDNPDAYTLSVSKQGVRIQGASASGVFRGMQTLRKAIGTESGDTLLLPYATIQDEPRFPYRGVMLDCARHHFSVDFIKRYIDVMALHGCNTLHWHLTDDQGWRFEVKSMPELTQKGSIRKQTVIGRNSGVYDGQEYGRGLYYTQEQCRDIVRYAAERHIQVIPEIDLPGHMVAALHVYPELGCTGGPYEVWPLWGVADDVLCAGNPKTLPFLKKVLDETADVFPASMIHIGGDESPRVRWKNCPKCQAKMKELGLKHEAELQTYINKELEAHLSQRGRTLIGWDETLEGGLSPKAVVMSWRGYEGGIAAAQQGHPVIMTPTSNCYIDYYQLKDQHHQPLAIGGYLPLSRVYEMEPVPAELTEEQRPLILGAQCNLWTEYVTAPDHALYMLLPRLDAMSEVQWTQPGRKDFDDFKARLPRMLSLYRKLGYTFCPAYE